MRILEAGYGDIVLLDVADSIAKGKAEDLMDAASLVGHTRKIIGTGDYKDTAQSDIVVIAAGFARKPGMSREELLNKNASIVKDVTKNIMQHTRDPIIIVVTNPLDAMAYVSYKASGIDHKRVIGMAGVLDSARMNLMLARRFNHPVLGIDSMVLGTHGETMVPVASQSKIDGRSLSDMMEPKDMSDVVTKTKSRGAEIVNYLGQGSAYYAPAAGVSRMVKAIVEDKREILPCSCYLAGEYGFHDIYLGVPCRITRGGMKEILELKLSNDELKALKDAAESVRAQINLLTF